MDIKKLVEDQTTKLVESGELEKMVAENVEASIRKVIADKFGGYSFQRDLEKKLSEEIEPVLKEISFSGYRDVIIDRIKNILTGLIDSDLIDKVEKSYKDIFIPTGEPMKMSDFFNIVRKEYLDEDGGSYEEYFSVDISDDEGESDTFRHITIKFDEDDSPRNHSNEFRMSSYKGEMFTIYNLKTEHLSYEKDNKALLKVKYLKTFERVLLNAYVNEQPIIFDIDDDIDKSKWEGDY